jgi:hypothetical protein
MTSVTPGHIKLRMKTLAFPTIPTNLTIQTRQTLTLLPIIPITTLVLVTSLLKR